MKIKESFGGMGGGRIERKKERVGRKWEEENGERRKRKWRKMGKKTTFNMEHSAFEKPSEKIKHEKLKIKLKIINLKH